MKWRKGKLKVSFGRIVSGLAVLVLATSLAWAQTTPSANRVRTIFDYKQELNLTDQQEQAIKTVLADLDKDIRVTRAKLTLIDVEVGDLIKNEGDLEKIKKDLKDGADLQVALRLADIVATRKINKVLSSEQLKKWRAIQASAGQQQK